MGISRIGAKLYAATRQAPGGMAQQAIAAVENALLDIKGKALGVRVCDLLGGAVRERFELYWSHCGTYRFGAPARHIDRPPIETLDDLARLAGRSATEVSARSRPTSSCSATMARGCTCRASPRAPAGRS